MPRGSKPGTKRGGRKRGTPNRRTILADKIFVAAAAHPVAGWQKLLSVLMDDQALPRHDIAARANASARRRAYRWVCVSQERQRDVRRKYNAKPRSCGRRRCEVWPCTIPLTII